MYTKNKTQYLYDAVFNLSKICSSLLKAIWDQIEKIRFWVICAVWLMSELTYELKHIWVIFAWSVYLVQKVMLAYSKNISFCCENDERSHIIQVPNNDKQN